MTHNYNDNLHTAIIMRHYLQMIKSFFATIRPNFSMLKKATFLLVKRSQILIMIKMKKNEEKSHFQHVQTMMFYVFV